MNWAGCEQLVQERLGTCSSDGGDFCGVRRVRERVGVVHEEVAQVEGVGSGQVYEDGSKGLSERVSGL